ncbi:MAG TPA: hypothetical protein DEV97_05995 [Lachnospiraceae bacterium]|nr:hypothetical protein [Lachnospiraceae bacterium]
MIEAITVKAACNGILRKLFPDMKIYGPDTTGALERPSFYTEIVPYMLSYETKFLLRQSMGFKISLMEEKTNEEFQLGCLAAIRAGFGQKLEIGGRKITISEVNTEYTGSKNDVFQITITMEWYDNNFIEDQQTLMEYVEITEYLNNR